MRHLHGFIVVVCAALSAASCHARAESQVAAFDLRVTNLEYAALSLSTPPPSMEFASVPPGAHHWYGRIMRRLEGDDYSETSHYIPFVAEYVNGIAMRAWCDENMNGSVRDEQPKVLNAYPSPAGARSFLTHLVWTAADSTHQLVDWVVRIILEAEGPDSSPIYRAQMVFSPVGLVTLQGRSHKAVLLDGNGDGRYSADFQDGLFVDYDDNGSLDANPMSPEFASFATPATLGNRAYRFTIG